MTPGWTEPLDPPVRVRAGDPHDGDRGHGAGQEGHPHRGPRKGRNHSQLLTARIGRFRVRVKSAAIGRKFSFANRVVNEWNSLPVWVVNSLSVNDFPAGLLIKAAFTIVLPPNNEAAEPV